MPDTPAQNPATAVETSEQSKRENAGFRLRLWPAILIVTLNLCVQLVTLFFGATNMHSMAGYLASPILATLLLLVWWLAFSRTPWRDRLVGLALFIVTLLGIVGIQPFNKSLILLVALPVLTTAIVALLLVSAWLRWPVRRGAVIVLLVAVAVGFTTVRVESLGGDLAPILVWRWTPTAAELLKAAPALPTPESGERAALPAEAGPEDWPGFRGASRDNRVTGVTFGTDWSTPPRELWRCRVGTGWSTFAAVGDYVFSQEERDDEQLVTCQHAATGKDVWVSRTAGHFENDMGPGPRATPEFDRGLLFALGPKGILQCLDAATGKEVWKRDITKDAETGVPGWGYASSPLVAGDRVIVFTSGGEGKNLIAYDRLTGTPVWQAGHGTGGYCSPQISMLGNTPQLLMLGDIGLQSFAPDTGTLLWEHPCRTKPNPRCSQPLVVDNDSVLMGSPSGIGARLLRIRQENGTWKAEEKWSNAKFRPYFSDMVLHKGHAYGFDGNCLVCVDLSTGEIRWKGKRYGGQVLLIVDMEMLLVLSEKGEVSLIPATPDGFTEKAFFKALNGKTWNNPVVAHGRLFARNAEEAVCFELPPAR